jgi:NTE family protein
MPNLCDPRTYLLPHAPFTTEGMQRFLSAQLPDEGARWPDKNVKVVAYEIFRNRRAVLSAAGRAQPRQAVAASSCIPLLFRPVSVGCSMYIDGGVHSTTNADVAVNEDIDLAICVAPMAIAPGDRPKSAGRAGSLLGPMADSARRSLYAEIADLKRARPEMDVLVVRPNKAEVGAMGSNPMNPRSEMPTLHAARANAREKFSNPDVRHILEKHGIAA